MLLFKIDIILLLKFIIKFKSRDKYLTKFFKFSLTLNIYFIKFIIDKF